jgi:hypothetical protein
MRHYVAAMLTLVSLTVVGVAQEKESPRLPNEAWGSQGVWLASAVVKDGGVEIQLSVPMFAPVEVKTKEGRTDIKLVASELRTVIKASDAKVYRKDGTQVDPKDLPRLLAKATAVVGGATKLDPFYLSVMRDDVLVFVVDVKILVAGKISTAKPGESPKN